MDVDAEGEAEAEAHGCGCGTRDGGTFGYLVVGHVVARRSRSPSLLRRRCSSASTFSAFRTLGSVQPAPCRTVPVPYPLPDHFLSSPTSDPLTGTHEPGSGHSHPDFQSSSLNPAEQRSAR